jgi:hypothetical protein
MVYGLLLKIFDKSHDFIFPIVNFPFIYSNIPAAPTYGVYISQLVRYYRDCGTYQDFLERGFVLTRKLLNQGFLLVQLKSHFERLTVATMTCFTPVFSGVRIIRSLALYVCFVDRCFPFNTFFCHCVVCSSSI